MPLLNFTSTTHDGNMSYLYGEHDEVLKNRIDFLDKHAIVPEDCVAMNLKNGDLITEVTSLHKGLGMKQIDGIEVDCVITNEKNVFLFLFTADCLPVAIYDPKQSVIALAHLGRHNAGLHFIDKIIQKLSSNFDTNPNDLLVTLGPSISKESYILSKDIPQLREPEWQRFLLKHDDTVAIDVSGFVVSQLIHWRIPHNNITVSPIDTATSKDHFSHYRSKRNGIHEGRFATVVGMR